MMENNLNSFRLYASVRFNRPIEDTDIISPGGYEFLFREAVASLLDLKFDFDDSELWVSEEDPCMIEFMQKNPDRISFPFVDQITREHLANVAHILDFYIDTDTADGSEPLIPVELVYASFTDDDGNRYDIRPEVIESVFKEEKGNVIDKIVAHLEDFSRRSPMGVVAYDGDSVVDSSFCDDESDFGEFFEEHASEISPTAMLFIQLDAEDVPLYADGIMELAAAIKNSFKLAQEQERR